MYINKEKQIKFQVKNMLGKIFVNTLIIHQWKKY